MTKIKISITKEILEKSSGCGMGLGSPETTTNCAFALAVRGILPLAKINGETIQPFPLSREFRITDKMTDFIEEFDFNTPELRRNMLEEEFELELPDWVVRKIGNGEIEEAKKIILSSKTLELV